MIATGSLLGALLCAVSPQAQAGPATEPVLWTIQGRVVDEAGKPLAGTGILFALLEELDTERALMQPSHRTDQTGRFEFTWENNGQEDGIDLRTMLLAAPGRAAAMWLRRDPRNARALIDKVIDAGDVVLPRGVVLQGRVFDAKGEPIEGATVESEEPLSGFFQTWEHRYVEYRTVTKTDEDGVFVLQGVVAPGAGLRVSADGYFDASVPFATTRDEPRVMLRRGGSVEGIVRDAEGRPMQAWVGVEYEVGQGRSSPEQTGIDGRFALRLQHPHRYRVEAWDPEVSPMSPVARSAVLSEPARDVEMASAQRRVDSGVTLHFVDAATGEVPEAVRAGVRWVETEWLGSFGRSLLQADRSPDPENPGEITLPGPSEDEPQTGTILIEADGYVPVTQEVEWKASSPPVLEIELEREASVEGVVLDDSSGLPLEGAYLLVGEDATIEPWDLPVRARRPGAQWTDARGRFRVGGLAAGKHTIRAFMPFCPGGRSITVQVRTAEARDGVELRIPRGTAIAGSIRGAARGAGWLVQLEREDKDDSSPFGFDFFGRFTRTAGLSDDGTFRVERLQPGSYEVKLLLPQAHHRGGYVEMALEQVQVGETELEQAFDVSSALPGGLAGSVSLHGEALPIERVVVLAIPAEHSGYWPPFGQDGVVWAHVGSDGSYDLTAADGDYRLALVDVATRIPLVQSLESVTVRSGEVLRRDLEVRLALVEVTLRAEREDAPVVAARLEVVVESDLGPQFFGGPDWDSGVGVSLAEGETQFELFLPERPVRFLVWSRAGELLREGDRWQGESRGPLAKEEILPEVGNNNAVEITVGDPPD